MTTQGTYETKVDVGDGVIYSVDYVPMDYNQQEQLLEQGRLNDITTRQYERKRIVTLRDKTAEPISEDEVNELVNGQVKYKRLLRDTIGGLIRGITLNGNTVRVGDVKEIKDVRVIDGLARKVAPKVLL